MLDDAIKSMRERKIKRSITLVILLSLLLICVYISVANGPIEMTFAELLDAFMRKGTPLNEKVIWDIRLPRSLMAIFVGAGLTVSGVGMQALFKNPMASPYILGLSSGAAFGAALAMVLGLTLVPGNLGVPSMAFIFCFLTLMIVYSIARSHGRVPVETLLLAGIAVGAFFSALVNLLTYLADEELAGIVYWMMGDLSQFGWGDIRIVMPMVAIGTAVIFYFARDLNAMMLGDNHALNLGIDVSRVRLYVLLASALVTAAAVSFVGIIGFVGLVIPHMIRLIVGPDHRILIPASILAGASFLLICDLLSQYILYPASLPIGILTALIGAPYFIYLLRRRRREIGW
jgi:iron complex transport system permease protein